VDDDDEEVERGAGIEMIGGGEVKTGGVVVGVVEEDLGVALLTSPRGVAGGRATGFGEEGTGVENPEDPVVELFVGRGVDGSEGWGRWT